MGGFSWETKIFQKGPVSLATTIPKPIVDGFKLRKGEKLVWTATNDEIIIKKEGQ